MNKIRELRKNAKINQTELASIIGVSQSTLSYWERGDYEPDNASLISLADYFSVSVDYILGRTDEPMKTKKAAPENGDGQERYVARNARLQELFDAIDKMDHNQLDALETIIEQVEKLGGWSKDAPTDDHQA